MSWAHPDHDVDQHHEQDKNNQQSAQYGEYVNGHPQQCIQAYARHQLGHQAEHSIGCQCHGASDHSHAHFLQ